MRKIILILIIITIFGLVVDEYALAQTEELKPTTLVWTAGEVGGGWYSVAGGFASLINKKEPKITIKVIPGGGVVNPAKVGIHDADIGMGVGAMDKMAFAGLAPLYKEAYPDIRSLGGPFGISLFHVCVAKDKAMGITTIAEMAEMVKEGKAIRFGTSMKGSSEQIFGEIILGFYGISYEDIKAAGGKIFHAVYSDTITLFKDRHIDFFLVNLVVPGAAVTEMSLSREITLLAPSDECLDFMHENYGMLDKGSDSCVIPAGTYKGQERDVREIAMPGEITINKNVPDIVAYTITRILCENVDELYISNIANRTFIPEKGWKNVAIPLHPGAEKYYREAGYMD